MQPLFIADWHDKVQFSTAGPQPHVLGEDSKVKIVLGALEAGQMIPSHPEMFAVYYFLEGNGWFTVDDQRLAVQAGSIIVTPAGTKRGAEATSRLAFLAIRVDQ